MERGVGRANSNLPKGVVKPTTWAIGLKTHAVGPQKNLGF